MCTVAEEAAETLHPMSYKKPENAAYYFSGFLMYVFAIRWQSIDKKMALEAVEKAAAHAPEPVVEAAVVQESAFVAPASPVVAAVVSAPAPSVSVTSWKTSDVVGWLSAIELPMHADAFKAHSVDGTMLLVLTEEDLYKSLGVASPLHRK